MGDCTRAAVLGGLAIVLGLAMGWAQAQPGTLVVLNKGEATASLIDRDTRQEVGVVATGEGPHEAVVSADGRTAVVADYGAQTPGRTLTVIDLEARAVVRTIDLGEYRRPHGLAWVGDGRLAVTAEVQKSLLVVDVGTGAVERVYETGQEATHMVVVSPDGRWAYTANIASGTVSAIDLHAEPRAQGAVRTVATGAGAEGIDVSPDGREVWVTNRGADTVSVVDAASLEVVATVACGRFPIRVKFTPDGGRALVSCAMSGEVAVFDVSQRREVARIAMVEGGDDRSGRMFQTGGPVPIGILIPPEGTQAFIACANADAVVVIDLERLATAGVIPTRREPDGMAFSAVELMPAVVPSRAGE